MPRKSKTRKDGLEGDDVALQAGTRKYFDADGKEVWDETYNSAIPDYEQYYGELLESNEEIENYVDNEDIISFNRYNVGNVKPKKFTYDKIPTGQKDLAWMPGYPHVGPGNPIYPWAMNELDEIARTHDIEYMVAKTPYDVIKADEKFLKSLEKYDTKTAGEWFAKNVANLGITFKYNFERRYGIAYPKFDQETLEKLRENEAFQKLEERWQLNAMGDTSDGASKGLLILRRENLGRLNQNRFLKWGMEKLLGKPTDQARLQLQFNSVQRNAEVFNNAQKSDWYDKHWSEIEPHVENFMDKYHEHIMKPRIDQYVKHRPMSDDNKEFRELIIGLRDDLRVQFAKYNETNWKPTGDDFRYTDEVEQILDKHFNGYQRQLYAEIEALDEASYAIDYNHQLLNFQREAYQLEKKYGPTRVKAEINTLVRGGKVVGKQLNNLSKLYSGTIEKRDRLTTFLENRNFEHDNPYQFEDMGKSRTQRAINNGKFHELIS